MSVFLAIKQKANLWDYVNKFVELDKTGHGLCPFHGDKGTKSFYIKNHEDDKWFCFGCGAGGDIFDFVEKFHNYNKIDAMKFLANELGIKLTEQDSRQAKQWQELKERSERAVANGQAGLKASNDVNVYLQTERSIASETIDLFRLGYFGQYDAIYIPIEDKYGRIVAGSMRFMHPAEGQPKYKNTKGDEVDFFKKREILYNLSRVRHHLKDSVYLVEGYFDVMSLHQNGFPVIGILGANITKEQVAILKDSVTAEVSIILVPDNDETGKKTVLRNYQLLRTFMPDHSIRVALIPDPFKDINEYCIKTHNSELDNPELHDADGFLMKTVPVEVHLVEQILDEEQDAQKQFVAIRSFLMTIKSPVIKNQVMAMLSNEWNKPANVIEDYFRLKPDGSGAVAESSEELLGKYELFVKNVNEVRIKPAFTALEKVVRGFNPGEVLNVMARSGVGKTAFALNLMRAITKRQPIHALFFSLEQQCVQICERMLAMSSGIETGELEEMFREGDSKKLAGIIRTLHADFGKVYTIDKDSLTLEDIEKITVHTNMTRTPVQMVVIDYLGYIRTEYAGDPYVAVSNVAKGLKALAKRLNVVIVVLHQLSREGESGGKPVTMRMARDSGVVEESADVIFGLWRPDLAEGLDEAKRALMLQDGVFFVEILKNRSGRCGRARLQFDADILRINDYGVPQSQTAPTPTEEPPQPTSEVPLDEFEI